MDKYTFRVLEKEDYNRGFLQLLERLTVVGAYSITYDMFTKRFNDHDNNTYNYVIIDNLVDKVIAFGTLLVEKKYIHNLSAVGHIEDIVVDADYSGQGIGKKIVTSLAEIAKTKHCYKVILNCGKNNVGFYNKCGFEEKEVEMVKYFKN